MWKNKIEPLFYIIHGNLLKWTNDLNVSVKSTKILKESIGVHFFDLGLGKVVLDKTPIKERNKQTNKKTK